MKQLSKKPIASVMFPIGSEGWFVLDSAMLREDLQKDLDSHKSDAKKAEFGDYIREFERLPKITPVNTVVAATITGTSLRDGYTCHLFGFERSFRTVEVYRTRDEAVAYAKSIAKELARVEKEEQEAKVAKTRSTKKETKADTKSTKSAKPAKADKKPALKSTTKETPKRSTKRAA